MKILELFGGIGACTQALKRLGIDFEIADYVEIDKYAVASYNAINGTNFEPQDITKWDKDIDVDLIMHGSPCQDFSIAGKQAGGDEDSGTRSSLMYETIRIVESLYPKYVVWENVKNLLGKKHRHNFDNYLEIMDALGYNNYYQVLNAKDYGIPQNRERVYTISIRKDIDNGTFTFPEKEELKLRLKDMLEDEVDEKYYLNDNQIVNITNWKSFRNPIKEAQTGDDICNCITAKGNTSLNASMLLIKSGAYARNFGSRGKIQDKDYSDTLVASMGTGGGNVPLVPQVIGGIGEKKSNGGTQWYQQDRIYDNKVALSVTTCCLPYYITTNKRFDSFIEKKYNNFIEKNGYIPEMFNPYNESELKDIAPTQSTQCGSTTSSSTVLKLEEKLGNKRLESLIKKTEFKPGKVMNLDLYNQTTNENISQCLTEPHHNTQRLFDGLRIRKLTPKECWRLMGFSDDVFEKAEKVNSNAQLYKQAGNSIVVDVLYKIFKNLFNIG